MVHNKTQRIFYIINFHNKVYQFLEKQTSLRGFIIIQKAVLKNLKSKTLFRTILFQKIGIISLITLFSIFVYINIIIHTSNNIFVGYYQEVIYNLTSNFNYKLNSDFLNNPSNLDPVFHEVKNYISNFSEKLGIKDIYLSTIDDDNKEIILVHTNDSDHKVGDIIKSKFGVEAFRNKEIISGNLRTRNSNYYSFYSPILDDDGKSLALIAFNLPGKSFVRITSRKFINILAGLIVVNGLLTILYISIATIGLWKILNPIYIIKNEVLIISNKILSINKNMFFSTHEFNIIQKLFVKSISLISNFIFSLIVYLEYIKFSISKIKITSLEILNKAKSTTTYITKVSKLNENVNSEVFKLKNQMNIFSDDIDLITDEIKNILDLNKSAVNICQQNNESLNEFLVEISILIKNFRSEQIKCENLTILSNKINNILGDILTITNETKLLSLNASIVAISAGEHGKSFGVIAKEVGELSQNIIRSTGYIQQTLIEISKTINVLNQESIEIFEAFKKHSNKSKIFSSNLSEIYNSIKNITLFLKDISFSSEKLNNKNEIILDNVTFLSTNSSSNLNSIKQIENLITKVNDNALAFRNNFEDLDDNINQIKFELSQFRL